MFIHIMTASVYLKIKKLILRFIEKSETIILVVVPCNVDIATTEALKMAQQVDPEGKRTLGKIHLLSSVSICTI